MRAPGGPRLLLRRLREVMAEPVTAQARLDRIVVLIASNMVAEVCSLYVARADGPFELFATEGLNREAVHLTTMRPGEGLVGLIAATAEPLALSDAQNHPAFSYKPETGEEIYQSFLGVPVLRGGSTLGVLVVQNRARRSYSEEEVEALQTTAMLLAELIASGELQALAGQPAAIAVRKTVSLKGAPIAEGLGLGHVVMPFIASGLRTAIWPPLAAIACSSPEAIISASSIAVVWSASTSSSEYVRRARFWTTRTPMVAPLRSTGTPRKDW